MILLLCNEIRVMELQFHRVNIHILDTKSLFFHLHSWNL